MQFTIVYVFFLTILAHDSFGRVLREIKLRESDEFDFKNRRGVTYIKPPSKPPPNFPDDDFNYTPERSNKAKLKYDIFERADERPGAKFPNPPVVAKPSTGQLPPQKFGPVLFPDEEAATAQNNGNKDNGQGGQNNQKGGTSGSLTNPPQGQKKIPDSENRKNNGNIQKEDSKNQNAGNSNVTTNRPQDNRNRDNGNRNNGRENPAGRRNCSSALGFILCSIG